MNNVNKRTNSHSIQDIQLEIKNQIYNKTTLKEQIDKPQNQAKLKFELRNQLTIVFHH